ncbi:MAG: hypothetical protein A2Z37_12755 [Chloroflexi bacterium RBG_19FT_COMBO_62_14]|nr:MAG: hypothetical protein A2Z37_12755 [Chloroflexi bacterium RBG_19FT_COMBO_62_14]
MQSGSQELFEFAWSATKPMNAAAEWRSDVERSKRATSERTRGDPAWALSGALHFGLLKRESEALERGAT